MAFTKDEQDVLKLLVKRELDELKEEGEKLNIANSPVLSSIYRMRETDIPFLKSKASYQQFLRELLKKL